MDDHAASSGQAAGAGSGTTNEVAGVSTTAASPAHRNESAESEAVQSLLQPQTPVKQTSQNAQISPGQPTAVSLLALAQHNANQEALPASTAPSSLSSAAPSELDDLEMVESIQLPAPAPAPVKRKPGRPPKVRTGDTPPKVKRGPGRPPNKARTQLTGGSASGSANGSSRIDSPARLPRPPRPQPVFISSRTFAPHADGTLANANDPQGQMAKEGGMKRIEPRKGKVSRRLTGQHSSIE